MRNNTHRNSEMRIFWITKQKLPMLQKDHLKINPRGRVEFCSSTPEQMEMDAEHRRNQERYHLNKTAMPGA